MAYGDAAYGTETYGAGETYLSALPVALVEVTFTDPHTEPEWLTVDQVEAFDYEYGRKREFERFSPGRLSVTVVDDDRRFDPTNTDSPYYPDVVPMRGLRVRVQYLGGTYDMGRGYIEDWPQKPNLASGVTTLDLDATDGFLLLADAELEESAYAIEVRSDAPAGWWRLGEAKGDAAGDSGPTGYDGVYHGEVERGTTVVAESDDSGVTLDGATQWIDVPPSASLTGNHSIECWFACTPAEHAGIDRILYGQGNDLALYLDSSGYACYQASPTPLQFIGTNYADGAVHHMVGTDDGTTQRLYVDGVLVVDTTDATTFAAGTVTIGRTLDPTRSAGMWAGSLDEVAIYTSALSAERIAAHYEAGATGWAGDTTGERVERVLDAIGWPAADRDIDTGNSTLQGADNFGGSALDHLQKVDEAEEGMLLISPAGDVRFVERHARLKAPYTVSQATFKDDAGEADSDGVNHYDDLAYGQPSQFLRNEVTITRDGGAPQKAEDATSRTRYGHKKFDQSGLIVADDRMARDKANWVLLHYKDAQTRIERLEFNNPEPWTLLQLLTRRVGDRITAVRRPPNGGSDLESDFHIEGAHHRFHVRDGWHSTLTLSPVDPYDDWWVLGTGELGTTTRLAY